MIESMRRHLVTSILAVVVAISAGCGSSAEEVGAGGPVETSTTALNPPASTGESTPSSTTTPPSTTTSAPGSTTSEAAEPTPGPHSLTLDVPVAIGGGVTLTLRGVEDSRCPDDVVCAWEGELEADVDWTDAAGTALLHLTWSYHSDPTPAPGGEWVVALEDATDTGVTARVMPAD